LIERKIKHKGTKLEEYGFERPERITMLAVFHLLNVQFSEKELKFSPNLVIAVMNFQLAIAEELTRLGEA